MSGPAYCITVWAESGTPMSPWAIARRADWMPGPSTVSGATPTSRPAASAWASSASPLSRSMLIGFSDQTCFPWRDGLAGDLGVDGRDRQVDHDLDLGMGQHVLAGSRLGDAVLLRLGLGPAFVEVAQDHDLDVGEAGEVLEIGVADHPGADEADPDRPGAGRGGRGWGGLVHIAHAIVPVPLRSSGPRARSARWTRHVGRLPGVGPGAAPRPG